MSDFFRPDSTLIVRKGLSDEQFRAWLDSVMGRPMGHLVLIHDETFMGFGQRAPKNKHDVLVDLIANAYSLKGVKP
jgi:hypothetical protein